MIKFNCTCGKKFNVDDKYAGIKIRCKQCTSILIVPQEESSVQTLKPESSNSDAKTILLICIGAFVVLTLIIGGMFGNRYYNEHKKKVANDQRIVQEWIKSIEPEIAKAKKLVETKRYNEASGIYKIILAKQKPITKYGQEIIQETMKSIDEALLLIEKQLTQIAEDNKAKEEAFNKAEEERMAAEQKAASERIEAIKQADQARKDLFKNDPPKSFEMFCSKFMANMLKNKFNDKDIYERYEYDLHKTDSLLRPLVGTLTFRNKGYDNYFKQVCAYDKIVLTIVPEEQRWTLEGMQIQYSMLDGWFNLSDPQKAIVIEAYVKTENP